jgi:hypothetical protein
MLKAYLSVSSDIQTYSFRLLATAENLGRDHALSGKKWLWYRKTATSFHLTLRKPGFTG